MNPPDSRSPDDNLLDAQAAEWLAQREMGFTPEQETEFLRWRLADPRHADALARLEETSAILEQLPALRSDPRLAPPPGTDVSAGADAPMPAAPTANRWRWSLGIAAGLAALIALTAIVWRATHATAPSGTAPIFATSPSGYQRVLLPDSSVAQLNSATALKVEFSPAERRVALAEGEAHFSVAKDAARPFVVEARHVRVRAVGTAFNVRLTENGVDVLVTEGVVRIERPDEPGEPTVLAANERAILADTSPAAAVAPPAIEHVDPATIRAALAWQESQFVFVESPLGDVVGRFNARNRVQLELGDPSLAARVVGGTFRQDDVETFVRLLESSGEITADRSDPTRIVLRRGR